ncbi:MAG: hypothetical protein WCU88_13200 [Elusimicrobiota bacterium]|jgi:hypothetical protein
MTLHRLPLAFIALLSLCHRADAQFLAPDDPTPAHAVLRNADRMKGMDSIELTESSLKIFNKKKKLLATLTPADFPDTFMSPSRGMRKAGRIIGASLSPSKNKILAAIGTGDGAWIALIDPKKKEIKQISRPHYSALLPINEDLFSWSPDKKKFFILGVLGESAPTINAYDIDTGKPFPSRDTAAEYSETILQLSVDSDFSDIKWEKDSNNISFIATSSEEPTEEKKFRLNLLTAKLEGIK